ncbi:MAG: class I SAM-dependent methyltransferase [Anaerolineae bacterium]|jgi:hypothetical protein|nr:class I SAM-dependent methyltransferase [Anaerolineae bacterium]MBT4310477.1 class I SAM-dependent methyltransferase [Anaerolineae bacterium]MBT4459229.1 class I SAM-dependent methyltransferase [Anaerolineae bacterium]MBT4841047.1 class I SAM-dependent methyltransferase [Anaerolineae bacterium]MBT6060618.1 class I SAM-dependent methyltransferase [Anaerolineae bacterium]
MIKFLFIILYFVSILSLIYGLWTIVPFFYGLPWVPTAKDRVRRALEMVGLKPDELLYDLGAGDGRIILMAAEEFGARAIGIEASPLQYAFTWLRCFFSGSKSKVSVRRENFYRTDLSDADVVFAYLTSDQAIRLQDDLAAQLKPGARVVAVAFDFPDWKPNDFDEGYLLFAYEMPPEKGGMAAYLVENNEEVDLP